MNSKETEQKYKKIISWEKEPKIDCLFGGFVFGMVGLILFLIYFEKGDITKLIFIGLITFGYYLINKGLGKNQKINYVKVK